MAQREALQTKTQEVEEMKVLLKEYHIIGVAGLEKVRAAQLQELRRKLKNDANLRVVKNALVRRAIAEVEEKPGLENLKDQHERIKHLHLYQSEPIQTCTPSPKK